MHKSEMGKDWLSYCTAEKDPWIIGEHKLSISQQSNIIKNITLIMSSIKFTSVLYAREVILPLHSVRRRSHLESWAQFDHHTLRKM